jgi:hypothetical protein
LFWGNRFLQNQMGHRRLAVVYTTLQHILAATGASLKDLVEPADIQAR